MFLIPSIFKGPEKKNNEPSSENIPQANSSGSVRPETLPEPERIDVGNEGDITLESLLGRIPNVDSRYVEKDLFNKGKEVVYKKGLGPIFDSFDVAFKEIIKDMDKTQLTPGDRKIIADDFLAKLEYFERLVGKANKDLVYKHFENEIEKLKEKVVSRIIQ